VAADWCGYPRQTGTPPDHAPGIRLAHRQFGKRITAPAEAGPEQKALAVASDACGFSIAKAEIVAWVSPPPVSADRNKASLNVALTISLPPFVKLAVDYKADLSKPENRIPAPANENKPPRRRTRQSA
jgi:hypothetical protein